MPFRGAGYEALVEQHIDAMPPAQDRDRPDRPILHQLPDLPIHRIVAHLERHLELHARTFDSVYDPVAVRQSQRHRLLQEDVFARVRRRDRDLRVSVRLARDDHRVHVGVTQHILHIRPIRHTETLRVAPPPSLIVVPACHEPHVVEGHPLRAIGAPVAMREAQHSDPDPVHL